MWIVHPDVRITRRKYYHLVTDENGEVLHRDRLWSGLVAFLDASEVSEYELRADDDRWLVRMERIRDSEGEEQWRS